MVNICIKPTLSMVYIRIKPTHLGRRAGYLEAVEGVLLEGPVCSVEQVCSV
jgi:hypothetical protein